MIERDAESGCRWEGGVLQIHQSVVKNGVTSFITPKQNLVLDLAGMLVQQTTRTTAL
jgi:hypothetical protein